VKKVVVGLVLLAVNVAQDLEALPVVDGQVGDERDAALDRFDDGVLPQLEEGARAGAHFGGHGLA
jgi:hypothetical protein